MTPISYLYIWDFDGVLSDSLTECLTVVSLAVFRHSHPDTEIDEGLLYDVCDAQIISELDQWMRPLRPFIVTGQDYLWQYFHKDVFCRGFTSMAEYSEAYQSVFCTQKDKGFKTLFYDSRKQLIRLMGEKYMSLFTTFKGAIHALRTSLARHDTYICTARDRQALKLILARHQIVLENKHIYSQDYCADRDNPGISKSEQILEILDRNGGRNQPFVIIEDQAKAPATLRADCQNMKVVVATYGYGLDSDWNKAGIENLVRVANPSDLIYEIY
jgi:phosphoglycolate phosphatase-like HAD superfamily hydrolase